MKALKFYAIWILVSVIVGVVGGFIGSALSHATLFVTALRLNNPDLIFLLPFGGVLISLLYHLARYDEDGGSNQVIKALKDNEDVPIRMFPLIFTGAVFSHLCGASVGRVGATIQLGGSLANTLSKLFVLSQKNKNTLIICSVSSVFSSLFGTPLAGAFWGVELAGFGFSFYYALPLSLISSFTARHVGKMHNLPNAKFTVSEFPAFDIKIILTAIFFILICSVFACIYCIMIFDFRYKFNTIIKNVYLRGFLFGGLLLYLTLLLNRFGFQSYNGMGRDVIEQAFAGEVIPVAFLLKMLFTSISITAGYKGGEVYPAVFTGATLGCAFANFIGIYPGFFAALGVGGFFCAVTKCPLASLFLCMELFGIEGALFYLITIILSYTCTIKYGLYSAQTKMGV